MLTTEQLEADLRRKVEFILQSACDGQQLTYVFINKRTNERRPAESHSGARGNILVGPPNIFVGPLWEENF